MGADQLLIRQSAREQIQCLLELDAPFPETLLVQGVAFHQMLAQHTGSPLTEAGSAGGVNPIADGDDGVEVEILNLIGFTVGGSC